MSMRDHTDLVQEIVERIKPELAGRSPQIQGAVLCDLLAIFLAGHPSEPPELREEIFDLHLATVRKLVEHYDKVYYDA